MSLPRVLLLSLGGTITMTPSEGGGIAPSLDAEALLRAVPALRDVADIEARSLCQLASPSLGYAELLAAAQTIDQAFAAGFDGAVLVQGTDTLEETAFLIDLLLPQPQPVIVTGAMRGAAAPGADGPANLLAAVAAAASPLLRDAGTLVALNDELHSARFVSKTHSSLPSAFTSPGAGPVALYAEGRIRPLQRPLRTAGLSLSDGEPVAVALHTFLLGDDGRVLGKLPELGYRGCVLAGLGAGHVPQSAVVAVEALARQMPVILASRCVAGPAFRDTYGYPGSERDLLARGVLPGGLLAPAKARLLLALALRASDPADVQSARAAAARAFAAFQ